MHLAKTLIRVGHGPGVLLGLVVAEARQCRDMARLLAAATCLCHLVAGGGDAQQGALLALLNMLASRLPRVRSLLSNLISFFDLS